MCQIAFSIPDEVLFDTLILGVLFIVKYGIGSSPTYT